MTTEEQIAQLEHRNLELTNDRERLLYWLCRAWVEYSNDDLNKTPLDSLPLACELQDVLKSFGYDAERVIRMIELGEPTGRPAPVEEPPKPLPDDEKTAEGYVRVFERFHWEWLQERILNFTNSPAAPLAGTLASVRRAIAALGQLVELTTAIDTVYFDDDENIREPLVPIEREKHALILPILIHAEEEWRRYAGDDAELWACDPLYLQLWTDDDDYHEADREVESARGAALLARWDEVFTPFAERARAECAKYPEPVEKLTASDDLA